MYHHARTIALAASLAFGLIPATAAAEDAKPSASADATALRAQFEQTHQKLQELEKQIQQIQDQAFNDNAELRERREKVSAMVVADMKEQGYEPESGLAKLSQLRRQISNPELDDAKKQELISQFESERKSFTEARNRAMASEPVAKAGKALQEDLLAEMTKIEPRMPELIDRMQNLQDEMMALYKQAQTANGS